MTAASNGLAVNVLALSETSEADAPSQIRAIYDEIRELCGVPMVALIFRHLAAHPGVLEEIWEAIGPSFHGARFKRPRCRLRGLPYQADCFPLSKQMPASYSAPIGEDFVKVRNTLAAYNRANPINQLAMLSLTARLRNDNPAIALGPPRLEAASSHTGTTAADDMPGCDGAIGPVADQRSWLRRPLKT
jgi:hypothetical protein